MAVTNETIASKDADAECRHDMWLTGWPPIAERPRHWE